MSSIIRSVLALSAVAAVAVAQDSTTPKLDAPCADAVIFMARGNNAPYHDSRTFPFVDATCGKLRAEGKTCDYIEIVFPKNGDFCPQIGDGVRNGQSQITAFNKKCPCTHIILNGFSQGAWIAGDILADLVDAPRSPLVWTLPRLLVMLLPLLSSGAMLCTRLTSHTTFLTALVYRRTVATPTLLRA